MTITKSPCTVCGEGLSEETSAICNACGRAYHLNQRSDRPGKDCGEVWVGEEHLALEFACNTCLHPEQPGALDDVLDLEEAAAAAGTSAAALERAAASGGIRHRRTAGGTYLFNRGDLAGWREVGDE
ncbi:MAG: hypothetical protein ACR2HN_01500 [Tepidiformaceae bacterium]